MDKEVIKLCQVISEFKGALEKIHDEVYNKVNNRLVEVFLCGGASSKNHVSVRDSVRNALEGVKYIRFMYPEDLFIEMMNTNKNEDLLSLENFLAQNCDVICIICESPGALVELGAFTNNESMFDKVIAVVNDKRQKNKSFIMLGPIKLIEKKNKKHVIFYSKDDIPALVKDLRSDFASKHKKLIARKANKNRSIDTIIGLFHFIPILFYFFNTIDVELLPDFLKYLFDYKNYNKANFDNLFNASLRLLYKDKYIVKSIMNGKRVYQLTDKGYSNVFNHLNNADISNKSLLYDKVRFGIMGKKYYKLHCSSQT